MKIMDRWATASMTDGIGPLRMTCQQAFYDGGLATRYKRRKEGRLYVYTSEEGNVVTVGRLKDLLAAGYQWHTEVEG
jgi:hypothetical protein